MNEITLIQNKIYEIRGQRVMLDFDLATLYRVETKALNRAVKRSIERFPERYMFSPIGSRKSEWPLLQKRIAAPGFGAAIRYDSKVELLGQRSYADIGATLALLAERHRAVYQSEQGVVLAHTYVLAGVVNSTSLTNDDVASLSELTTEKFYTESLALRLTAVLRTTYTFFVCHVSLIFKVMQRFLLPESGSGTDGGRCTSDNPFCASS